VLVLAGGCTGSTGSTVTLTVNSTSTRTTTIAPVSTAFFTPTSITAIQSATISVTTKPATSLPPVTVTGIAAPSPEALAQAGFAFPNIARITAQELKQRVERKDVLVLVDARDDTVFDNGFIAGAINIPYSDSPLFIERIKAQLRNLPVNQVIVFYGSSAIDSDSATLAQMLLDLKAGQPAKNILVLWKGYNSWTALGYPHESNPQ
jgi:rhodanese-related sulfurtransferase